MGSVIKKKVPSSKEPKGEFNADQASNVVAFSAVKAGGEDPEVASTQTIDDEAPLNDPINSNDELPGVVLPDDDDLDNVTDGDVELTEDAIAEEFARLQKDRLRFDHDAGKWFVWRDTHWEKNKTELAFDFARRLCREHRQGQSRMASKKAAEGVEHMARRDQRLVATSDTWDGDPMLLSTLGGTIELETGKVREPRPTDYITKRTTVEPSPPGTPCPTFMKFLAEATANDAGLQRLLQQYAGYCLTGVTKEQVLLFIYGPGGNGKSVLQTVIADILGDYAKTAAMETFAYTKNQRHLTEIAMLRGARFVGVSETEKGQQWSEARINQLTGGDRVTANFMRQDHFTFHPEFKLLIVGNHKPQLGTVNDAARRRFIIVPFLHKPTKPDKALGDKLRKEYPAILRWMIDGCLDWRKNGLVMPAVVTEATDEYFEEQDLFGRWITECCECGPDKKAQSSALYASWKEFSTENGEQPGPSKAFASTLKQRGFEHKKISGSFYLGIALKSVGSLNYKDQL